MRLVIAALLLAGAPAAAQTQSETMPAQTPSLPASAAPVAEQRPYQLRTPRRHRRGPLSLAQGPVLSDGRRRGRARLSARRERLFRSGDGAAPAADRHPVRGDARADPGGRQLGPGPRRRLALLVGVPARRAIPHLVPPAGRRRRAEQIDLRRAGRGRGQAIFPPRRDGGQPRRPLRRHPGRRRRLGALPAAHPRPRHRPRHRDGDRGRHRPAGLDRRQPRHRLHRGQRAIGAATAPGCTGSASPSPRTARSTRRPRISPSPSASAAPRTGAAS